MNDKQALIIGTKFIEMYESFQLAIGNAGGAPDSFKLKYLKNRSGIELFNNLATNNIRFYCTRTHKLVKIETTTVDPRYHKSMEEKKAIAD